MADKFVKAAQLPIDFIRTVRYARWDARPEWHYRGSIPIEAEHVPAFFVIKKDDGNAIVYIQGEMPHDTNAWMEEMIQVFDKEDMSTYWDEIHMPLPPARCTLSNCPDVSHIKVSGDKPFLVKGKTMDEVIQMQPHKTTRRRLLDLYSLAKTDVIHGARFLLESSYLVFADGSTICEGKLDPAVASISSERFERRCSACFAPTNPLKKCAKCGVAHYCNQDCQKNHWPQHRSECSLLV